jgi:hypothetical protein
VSRYGYQVAEARIDRGLSCELANSWVLVLHRSRSLNLLISPADLLGLCDRRAYVINTLGTRRRHESERSV